MEIKAASTQSPVEDPNFMRMAYEIAFTEYAIVLAQELSAIQFFFDPQDALVDCVRPLTISPKHLRQSGHKRGPNTDTDAWTRYRRKSACFGTAA